MDRILLDMEDWSSDFSLDTSKPRVQDDEENEEDWDKELVTCTTLDLDGYASQREENNSFFRSLLPNVDLALPPVSIDLNTYNLVEEACGSNKQVEKSECEPSILLTLEGFAAFDCGQLQEWLKKVVRNKVDAALALEQMYPNCPRIENLFGKSNRDALESWCANLSYYIRRGCGDEARKMTQEYFDYLDVAALSESEVHLLGGWSSEILQLIIEIFVPSNSNDGQQRLFAQYVQKCWQLFSSWHLVLALIECRYVLHHWHLFERIDTTYCWQLPLDLQKEHVSAENVLAQEVIQRYLTIFYLVSDGSSENIQPSMILAVDMGLLSLSTNKLSLQVSVLCDLQNILDRKSPLHERTIPSVIRDDPSEPTDSQSVLLLPLDLNASLDWLENLYPRLEMPHDLFIKAKCAHVLSRSLLSSQSDIAESLAFEALRLLDIGYSLSFLKGSCQHQGLLSPFGRECLEIYGAALSNNKKYSLTILAYECAENVYCFNHLNQRGYEKIDRLCTSLCLREDDLPQALIYHDRVLQWSKNQENLNEFIYITQMINTILLQQNEFRQAEQRIIAALDAIHDPSAVNLPAPYHVLTPSTSFRFKYTDNLDSWLLHDLTLHLCLRDIYRATGRWLDAILVLQHILAYENTQKIKLPRGKRVALTLLIAEDALKTRQLELSISMLRSIEHNAMELKGVDHRNALDIMSSYRYIKCRFRCYMHKEQYHRTSLWIAIAKAKGITIRQQAEIHLYYARCLIKLHHRSLRDAENSVQRTCSSRWNINNSEASVLRLLSPIEQSTFQDFMERHWALESYQNEFHTQAWNAFEFFGTLNDNVRQLKTLLLLIDVELLSLETKYGVPFGSPSVNVSQLITWVTQALTLAKDTAQPMYMIRSLVASALSKCWQSQYSLLDLSALYNQATLLLKTVYLKMVDREMYNTTWLPMLPFSPNTMCQLEQIVGSLLFIAVNLSHLGSPPELLGLVDLQQLYWYLNKITYWTQTTETKVIPVAEPQLDNLRTASGQRLPRQSGHQKQLSLSSLSDMMASVFRRSNDPFLVYQQVPDPPFAYVAPLKGMSGLQIPSPDLSRVRSYSAPVGHEGSFSSTDWDDTDLELEVEGADFWRACTQEHRKKTMAKFVATCYTESLDPMWGLWHSAVLSDKKFQNGRLTPTAHRQAYLTLIRELSKFTIPMSSATDEIPQFPWSILMQSTSTFQTISFRQPVCGDIQVSWFTSNTIQEWQTQATKLISLEPSSPDISRVVNLLGANVLMKVLSSVLLENPLIVVSSSSTIAQEVLYVIVSLLHPFQWHYLFLPYMSMSSIPIFLELLRSYTAYKSSTTSEAPFLIGMSLDAWSESVYRLTGFPCNKQCGSCISVLHVETNSVKFQKASNPSYSVNLPSKLRKLVIDSPTRDSIQHVINVIVTTCQKTPNYRQWFRLENLDFVKQFQLTWTYQASLKQIQYS
ncbi:hypothetical protein THRCLA_04570 [Thraustotheca clavata]|uniref:cDENN domain-containing protein n=1 Tax=Thraustotheca clavata TaxID=74557 RepID=A0A1V9ZYP8_9STRA|nr:hypothetical protein THRCLA_04570 [Thraustotheca clavata]